MSEFLDQILRPEVPNVLRTLPEEDYKLKRLSRLLGEDVVFHLRGLPYGKVQELKELERDRDVHILLAGCAELRDPALLARFEAPTPVEAVKALLLPGEIEDLERAVERLSGYRGVTIEKLKNA